MKKILFTSAAANMIWQFNKRNIEMLLKQGNIEIHVATNFLNPGTLDAEQTQVMVEWMSLNGVHIHQIDFKRGLGSLFGNISAMVKIRKIISENDISLIHTQSPIGSVLTRLAQIGLNVKVIYTAHGFHFYKGAPFLYWIIFFPIELILSSTVDVLVTINDEDMKRARRFFAKRTVMIPGVGVDVLGGIERIDSGDQKVFRKEIRDSLGISYDDVLILNVGELSNRKNQIYLLRAVLKLNNPHVHVALAGIGPNKHMLDNFVLQNGLSNQVHFLGYRTDISELHFAADLNVFPSKQEGLAIGGLESVADGLYILGSDRRGIRDYILSDEIGKTFSLQDEGYELVQQMQEFIENPKRISTEVIGDLLMKFDMKNVDEMMLDVYLSELQP